MSRYIDAEKLKRSIEAQCRVLRAIGIDELTEMTDLLSAGFFQEIENAPTADVAEVRHGRWEQTKELYSKDGGLLFFGKACSICGNIADEQYNYCPNCGALMVNEDD